MSRSGLPSTIALDIEYRRSDGTKYHMLGTDVLFHVDGRYSMYHVIADAYYHALLISGCPLAICTNGVDQVVLAGYRKLGENDTETYTFPGYRNGRTIATRVGYKGAN